MTYAPGTTFEALEENPRPRSVHLLGTLTAAPGRSCRSCGDVAGVREVLVSLEGWPFSAHLCPACLTSMLADVR